MERPAPRDDDGLHGLAETDEFISVQTRFGGVVRDVPAQALIRLFATEQVIKRIRLPESSLGMQLLVELRGREALPRLTLLHHALLVGERSQHVNVVRSA